MKTTKPFALGFVLLPKFSSLTLASLVEPLRIANYSDGNPLYSWHYLSADGGAVPGCSGYSVPTDPIAMETPHIDAVIVCGGWNAERYEHAEMFRWLRLLSRKGVTLGAAEMGSYVLARAGLLKNHSATIHWHCHNAFSERFPGIDLQRRLFVIDGNRWTCGGGTACIDMMLHDVGKRYGTALAAEVADLMIHSPIRDGMQPQKDTQATEQTVIPPVLIRAIEFMQANVEQTVKIPELAQSLGLSQRKLERLFNKHYHCSAVAFYRRVRLQHARVLLTQTDMSVLDICIACGFASSSYFSKSYADQFGLRPRDHRLAWPDSDQQPHWPGLNTPAAASERKLVSQDY